MIDKIDIGMRGIQPIIPQPNVQPKGTATVEEKGKSFGSMLSDALKEVNQLQTSADQKVEDLTMGKAGVTNHEAIIALEKADVAFQLMTRVQSKIIRAYEEVMRTQV